LKVIIEKEFANKKKFRALTFLASLLLRGVSFWSSKKKGKINNNSN
jgi:hypothetical protein